MSTSIRLTFHDYRALPDSAPRMELLDGDFVVTPAPSPRHQRIVSNLDGLFIEYFRGHPRGTHYVSPIDVYLGESDVAQPDLVCLLGVHVNFVKEHGIAGAPDLCIEVLSPSTAGADFGLKRAIYTRAGVLEYWIVDPKAETVALYRPQESAEPRIFRRADRLASPLLPDFAPTLEAIFAL